MKKIEVEKAPKKAAIVSYGTRITLSSNHVRSVDLYYIREYLLNVLGRTQVDYVNHPLKEDLECDYYKDIETTDLNDYDEVYIYNCIWNAFGGIFKHSSLVTIKKLYDFKGDIIYCLMEQECAPIDYSLFLKYKNRHEKNYIWNSDNKKIGGKYPIDKEIIDNWGDKVYKRMKIAFCGFDYNEYVRKYDERLAKKRVDDIVREYLTLNHDAEWFNMELFEYCSINERLDLKLQNYTKQENPYDFVYFGNRRPGNRNKKLQALCDTDEFSKLWIGYDPEFKNTTVMNYVAHDDLFKLIGEKCLTTLMICDEIHNNNIKTPRFFECMLLDVVAFMYIEYDTEKKFIKNEFLKDFIYVSNREELVDKINKVKNDPELYNKIIELERAEVIDTYGHFLKK